MEVKVRSKFSSNIIPVYYCGEGIWAMSQQYERAIVTHDNKANGVEFLATEQETENLLHL